ncbi:MAG: dUTP diphosphatase [Pseudomonadota bacterium]|nr:dUTP diphosphatase [Pseudomonadota bacterium]
MTTIKFKLIHPHARLPAYATSGAAAFDFYAPEPGRVRPCDVTKVGLGLACEIPPGFAMLLLPRSGHGLKHNAGIPHGVGLIDSDYRNEIAMVFRPDDGFHSPLTWQRGDRIAQGLIIPAPQYTLELVPELSDTERGMGGFGSTGQ